MRNKANTIDEMFNDLVMKIASDATRADKETIERLTKENIELREANVILTKAADRVAAADDNFFLTSKLIDTLKNRLNNAADKDEEEKLLENFLDCFFDTDFVENTYEVPLWFGCAVQYYNNRDTIFKILKMLDIEFPGDLESIKHFRLPQDWTEEELDAVFEHMGNHVNCNNCVFKDNLRFWKPNALDDPIKVCKAPFTEIPWQFLLRNPLLKKEKYLKEIGRMFCVPKEKYRTYQWLRFAKITDYQELTAEEIKIIIDNIDYTYYNNKDEDLKRFLLNNIELIDNEVFLDALYTYNKDSYDFKYNNTVLKMPHRYIKYYMRDTQNLEWLKRHKDKFTKEQITELTLAALGVGEE
jgi:hypothetical protein